MTHRLHRKRAGQHGFPLIVVMIAVAIIGILTAIAFPLYAGIQGARRQGRGRREDAGFGGNRVDVSCRHPPADLGQPDRSDHRQRGHGRPVHQPASAPPAGWSAYADTSAADGTCSITTTGDNVTVHLP